MHATRPIIGMKHFVNSSGRPAKMPATYVRDDDHMRPGAASESCPQGRLAQNVDKEMYKHENHLGEGGLK